MGTYEAGDGAVPGEYAVTVLKTESAEEGIVVGEADESDDPEEEEEAAEEDAPEGVLPAKYQNKDTSGLSASVTQGGDNNFSFDLTDE
jgi:hypothetical protein